jgi:hypothetical protein
MTLARGVRDAERRRTRGYITWRPQARTRALLAQVDAVLVEYADYLPLTVRQIFYRLVAAHGYEKTEAAAERLGEHLRHARRAGPVPFAAIRDDGIEAAVPVGWESPEEWLAQVRRAAGSYRRQRQAGQPVYAEVWCEAAGMVPLLERYAKPFGVPVYSGTGQPSITAAHQAARLAVVREIPTILLHLGDYDPTGESLFESYVADVLAFAAADAEAEGLPGRVVPVRVALTGEQVRDLGILTAPAKDSDRRTPAWIARQVAAGLPAETAQLEALPPDLLGPMLVGAIRARLNRRTRKALLRAEGAERAALVGRLAEPDRSDNDDDDGGEER